VILRALVLRPIVHEKLRTTITIAGIAVGVAVVVAIQLANQSALRAFRESVDAVAGRANYQIASDAVPLPEDVLIRLQPLWQRGVRFAPVIDVEGMVQPRQIPVRLLAVDLLSDLHFRDYRYARIVTTRSGAPATSATMYLDLFRDDSIVLPASFARELGLAAGDTLELNIGGQPAIMTLRGILEPHGPATAFNGAIAICDIATAQKRFGFRGRLTRVDLLVPSEGEREVLESIRRVLPPGARLERPSRRNERVEKMLRAFRVNLFALAGIALLVGMLLVYNAVLISILRRRRDVGIVKTLGVAPRQIFAAFIAEGLLFGLLGSLGGIVLGKALAIVILRSIGRTINDLYVTSRPDAITLTGGVIALGMAVGTILSVLSALQPSFEAARVPPNTMIRPGLQQRVSRRRERTLALIAAGCFVAAIAVSPLPPVRGIAVAGYASVLLVVIGFSLLAPAIVRATSALLRPLFEAAFGIVGTLSAASLPASLRRTAVASAALSLATGMMVAVALMVGSFRETVRIWVDQTVSSDMWLRPSRGLSNAQVALFPSSISDDLRTVDFIAAFDRARGRDIVYGQSIITVGSGDLDVSARFGNLPMVTPRSSRGALTDAVQRGGAVVSEAFSLKFHKRVGDSVALPTVHGIRQFPITGVYRDYSSDRGTVIMDRELYVQSFDDDRINTVVLFLKNGVNREWARRQLEARFGRKYNAFVVMNAEVRREVMKIFDQTFMITYALLAVAVIVAVLGIVNTLAALILERTRELALLRVTGMSAHQLRVMIVLESSLLGIASSAVGIVMGYILSLILIYVINKQSFGWTIEFHTPAAMIAASLIVTFAAAALSGLIPARLANRIRLAEALKSE